MEQQVAHHHQHIVAVPLPYQGHITSLMRFCKMLARHDTLGPRRLQITFIDIHPFENDSDKTAQSATTPTAEPEAIYSSGSTSSSPPILTRDASTSSRHDPLAIRRVRIALPTPSSDFRRPLSFFFESQLPLLLPSLRHLILCLDRQGPPITCFLSDIYMMLPMQDIVDQLRVPRVVLFPFSASRLLLSHYIWKGGDISIEQVLEALKTSADQREVFCRGLPGLPTLFKTDIPTFKHGADDNLYMWNLAIRTWEACQKLDLHAVVVNTFYELESSALKVLSTCNVPIFETGPWIENLDKECSTSLWKEDEACLAWLNQQPEGSVLYISFGSVTVFSESEFGEFLKAVLSSKQRFLWAIRRDLVQGSMATDLTDIISMSDGLGFVVEWAPQLTVLAHPSVGGFFTHCGWNSVMESIAHGVPMLCWPYFADQLVNARCIVDEWKVGLEMEFHHSRSSNSFIGSSIQIERAIRSLMEGEEGKAARQNVAVLKSACTERLSENGGVDAFLKSLFTPHSMSTARVC
ncbi:hypothetical protein KP509_21G064800 [Ceratopteris richardii]|uniref:Glycosyltransferase n=1 Tax=Ceratopteris richardii TaxID=49495 RepID=A0A8T2SE32_CERRI|nr:hypothetical protein KP509_21G064800 [Ceratopteris richardii]